MSGRDDGPGRSGEPEARRELPVVDAVPEDPGPVQGRERARLHIQARKEGLDRRSALKLMAAAAALPALGGCEAGTDGREGGPAGAGGTAAEAAGGAGNPKAAGTPWDPDLLDPTVWWDGVLTEDELDTLAVLCDLIIPEDDRSPSASSLGAHEYIDEWVSAPYDGYRRDQVLVRGGLVWLDAESARRFGPDRRFRTLTPEQQRAICDDICYLPDAAPEHRQAARFFAKVRDLTAGAFYTTDEGMADIGYVGNVPVHGDWPLPPPEAFTHLGLDLP